MKSPFATLSLIYNALVLVQVVFGVVVFLLNYTGQLEATNPDLTEMLQYVLISLVPAGAVAGLLIYKQMVSAIDQKLTPREKFGKLQSIVLVRSGLFEAPSLFAAVAAMITGDNTFLLFTALIVTLFIVKRPTMESVAEDLGLSRQEVESL